MSAFKVVITYQTISAGYFQSKHIYKYTDVSVSENVPSGIKVRNKWHGAIVRIHVGIKFVVLPLWALLTVATWYYLRVAGARGVQCHEPIITDRNPKAQRAGTVEWRRNCIWMGKDRGRGISLPGLWAHYTNWNVRNCICWCHLKILNRRAILLGAITSDWDNETRRGTKGGIIMQNGREHQLAVAYC